MNVTNQTVSNKLVVDTLNVADGTITGTLNVAIANVTTLNVTSETVTTLNVTNQTVTTLNVTNETVTTLNVTNQTVSGIINVATANVITLNATNQTVSSTLNVTTANIATLNATNQTVSGTLIADTLRVKNLSTDASTLQIRTGATTDDDGLFKVKKAGASNASIKYAATAASWQLSTDDTTFSPILTESNSLITNASVSSTTALTSGWQSGISATVKWTGTIYHNFVVGQPIRISSLDYGGQTSIYVDAAVTSTSTNGTTGIGIAITYISYSVSANWTATGGFVSAIGMRGAQGTDGYVGQDGAQGAQGITGSQGLTGSQGRQGTTGFQGIQGTTGTGSQGLQGISGSGGQGTQGVQGRDGTNSGQGAQGIQGRQGTSGFQGIQGTTGSGSQGIQGFQGTTGTGSQGAQGVQGRDGTNSGQGAQGIQGTTGTGSQGLQGISGSGGQGTQGIQGIASVDFTPLFTTTGTSVVKQTAAGKFEKTALNAGAANWDTSVYSFQGYVRGCYATAKIATTSSAAFGLTSDPTTDASYASIDYCFQTNSATGAYSIYENGVIVYGPTTYGNTDQFSIIYDGYNVRYYLNSSLLRTASRAMVGALYFDSSLYSLNSAIENVGFGPMAESVQGLTGIQGIQGPLNSQGIQGVQGTLASPLPRISSAPGGSTATLTWNSSNYDMYILTAQTAGLTIAADSANPANNGQRILFRIKNSSASSISLTLTSGAKGFRAFGTTIPTTITTGTTLYLGCIYNLADDRWDVIAAKSGS